MSEPQRTNGAGGLTGWIAPGLLVLGVLGGLIYLLQGIGTAPREEAPSTSGSAPAAEARSIEPSEGPVRAPAPPAEPADERELLPPDGVERIDAREVTSPSYQAALAADAVRQPIRPGFDMPAPLNVNGDPSGAGFRARRARFLADMTAGRIERIEREVTALEEAGATEQAERVREQLERLRAQLPGLEELAQAAEAEAEAEEN